jgi:hypothetical protein
MTLLLCAWGKKREEESRILILIKRAPSHLVFNSLVLFTLLYNSRLLHLQVSSDRRAVCLVFGPLCQIALTLSATFNRHLSLRDLRCYAMEMQETAS